MCVCVCVGKRFHGNRFTIKANDDEENPKPEKSQPKMVADTHVPDNARTVERKKNANQKVLA